MAGSAVERIAEGRGAPMGAFGAVLKAYRGNQGALRAVISFAAVAILWELIGRYIITTKLLFVPVSDVFLAFIKLASSGELTTHVQVSFSEFFLGFVLAALVGISFGLIIATSDAIRGYVDPLISALYATPIVALAPLFILWLGIEMASKVAVIFLMAFFPIIINTVTGIRSTEEHLVEAARSFGASRPQVFRKVLLPFAVPFIIAGLRLGVGRGIVAVVVAELFGARAGLGYLIVNSAHLFDAASLFVATLILAGTGVGSTVALQTVEKRLAPWRTFKV